MAVNKIENPFGLYFLTLTVVGWIDIFSRRRYREILIESLRFCQNSKGLGIYAYVIMTNHIHLIAEVKVEPGILEVLTAFKKFTGRTISKSIQEEVESRREWMLPLLEKYGIKKGKPNHIQIWRPYHQPRLLTSPKFIRQKVAYIHNNPVKAGWVKKPEDYLYSSARSFMGKEGLLDIIPINQASWLM